MQNNLFTHSRFEADEFGNGGAKRTAQVQQLLAKYEVSFTVADFELYRPTSKNIDSYIRGFNYNKKTALNLANTHRTGQYIKTFEEFITKQCPALLVWESVSEYYLLLAKTLHAKNVPIIALPHNIESLVKGVHSFSSGVKSPDWFIEELDYLKYANKVFTISLEEQWLLSLYGIDADYLPYYPTETVKSYLLDIRTAREKQQRAGIKKILLIGTFHNMPTLKGYTELLKHISKFNNLEISVAGFGSEKLIGDYPANVKIWGSVSTQVLKELLTNTDVVILNQEATTGALTRIPELLIAGIPIIANPFAAKSYYDLQGINVYHNNDELLDLIYTKQFNMPPIPQSPLLAEKRFIDTVKKLIK